MEELKIWDRIWNEMIMSIDDKWELVAIYMPKRIF